MNSLNGEWEDGLGRRRTYPVENHIDIPTCVDDRGFAAEERHFSQHTHDSVLEVGEVRGEDSGSLWVIHVWGVLLICRGKGVGG